MSKNEHSEEFPDTPLKRGVIAAKAGLKVGANYARYAARRAVSGKSEAATRALHDRNAKDIFKQLTKLRGTALKMAQGMSMDPGIIPAEFIDVMSQAQYSVPPMNPALVQRLIKQSLGAPVTELFAEFEAEALAAASIGQVHKAVLKDGRVAAVKVQYPNIRQTIEADLKMARGLARRVVKGDIDPFIDEVRSMMMKETDYRQEGESMEFFAGQYSHDSLVTPRWIPELSTETVLTMTFLEGLHLPAFLADAPAQETCDHFGQLLFDFSHSQVASGSRFIHADFHPGNFLFQESGSLGVIDFGCVKTMPAEFMADFLRVFRATLDEDHVLLRDLYVRLDILNPDGDPSFQEKIFAFFLRMGEMIVRPYQTDTFDFGDAAFAEEIKSIGMEAMEFREREVIGSPHFIFVNRVVFGLLSMLSGLKARVSTQAALANINATIDQIESKAA
ncbi:MAG: putative unusual protein kinase regulating ubiquinone biosynthesis (AarF/ABC1/UbiB family) [Rhodothermales bacterium]|jgi:predicted unusual protein kinase regulating ubiquinone biosynthesis (AarF/ABC1/UbiB family)